MPALALAWVAKNPNTSTVILGASKPSHVTENLKALEVLLKLTDEVMKKIEEILENKPEGLVRTLFLSRCPEWQIVIMVQQPTHGRPPLDPLGKLTIV